MCRYHNFCNKNITNDTVKPIQHKMNITNILQLDPILYTQTDQKGEINESDIQLKGY